MKSFLTVRLFTLCLVFIFGCKARQLPDNQSVQHQTSNPGNYWKEVNEIVITSLSCPGRVMPIRYSIFEVNYPDLRKLLLKKSSSGSALNLDTTILAVPIPNGTLEEFALTQVQVLPPELSEKYPDIKTFHGKSLIYPQDIIRLDIAPKGISYMIMSTRGTIIMDPFCNNDSVHVIVYNKKDLPEGAKEDFEK